jgi:microcystin-dependent protein
MYEPFLGQLAIFGGLTADHPPQGWKACDGRLLPIGQYQALFNVLGTRFGGDGTNNFALPDLRGRVALGQGQGPDQPTAYQLGQTGGAAQVALTAAEIPPHQHAVRVTTATGTAAAPTGGIPAPAPAGAQGMVFAASGTALAAGTISAATQPAAAAQAHNNLQPFIALRYCIAVEGFSPKPA